MIDPLIGKRQQLLLATQLCRMVLKVREPSKDPLRDPFNAVSAGESSNHRGKRRERVLVTMSVSEAFANHDLHGVRDQKAIFTTQGFVLRVLKNSWRYLGFEL